MNLLLDTCAALWIASGDPIAPAARDELARALQLDEPVYLSPITAWEVGLLAARRRVVLGMAPLRWWQRLVEAPGVKLAGLGPEILVAASFLPEFDHRDPGDRIIVATAREYGYRVVTRDRRILAYAECGFCRALAC